MRLVCVTVVLVAFWGVGVLAKISIDTVNPLEGDVEYPKNFTTVKSLQEFVRLVDEHNLNVSVIISKSESWSTGNLKEALALTLTFPVNSEQLTKTKLGPGVLSKLSEIANKEKLTVAGSSSEPDSFDAASNNPQGIPITKALKIFSGIKNGKTGFVFDEDNYVAQHTFQTETPNGNLTTKVLHGNVEVEVVDKSNISEEDVKIITKFLIDSVFIFEEEDVPRAIHARLTEKYPGEKWQIAADVGKDNFIDAKKSLKLKIFGDDYLIYAVSV